MTTNLKLLLISSYKLKYVKQTRRHRFFTKLVVKLPLTLSRLPSTQADSGPNLFLETATKATFSSEHAMTDSNVVGGIEEVNFAGAWTDSSHRRGRTTLHSVFKESKQKFPGDREYFAR